MGVYLKTFMGYRVDPLNPEPETITLTDIAHALSFICRANGQGTHFYSVAQHCINAAKEAKERGDSVRVQLGCLLRCAFGLRFSGTFKGAGSGSGIPA